MELIVASAREGVPVKILQVDEFDKPDAMVVHTINNWLPHGPRAGVSSLTSVNAPSAREKYLISGSTEGEVCIWNLVGELAYHLGLQEHMDWPFRDPKDKTEVRKQGGVCVFVCVCVIYIYIYIYIYI